MDLLGDLPNKYVLHSIPALRNFISANLHKVILTVILELAIPNILQDIQNLNSNSPTPKLPEK